MIQRTLCGLGLLGVAACPSDPEPTCGPSGVATPGLSLVVEGTTTQFTSMVAGANNDCPADPEVVSLSLVALAGTQPITICVPRPDLLGDGVVFGAGVGDAKLIDLRLSTAGCMTRHVVDTVHGTLRGHGVCDDGVNVAGFALTVDATVTMTKTCGDVVTPDLPATLSGTIAVVPE